MALARNWPRHWQYWPWLISCSAHSSPIGRPFRPFAAGQLAGQGEVCETLQIDLVVVALDLDDDIVVTCNISLLSHAEPIEMSRHERVAL